MVRTASSLLAVGVFGTGAGWSLPGWLANPGTAMPGNPEEPPEAVIRRGPPGASSVPVFLQGSGDAGTDG